MPRQIKALTGAVFVTLFTMFTWDALSEDVFRWKQFLSGTGVSFFSALFIPTLYVHLKRGAERDQRLRELEREVAEVRKGKHVH